MYPVLGRCIKHLLVVLFCRVSSSEVEGNDGVFSTQESVNVFDFRVPAGIGLKIARHGGTANSIFSRGDSVFIGSTEGRLQIKGGSRSRVQHYSLISITPR
jgi:hypothetical protein